VLLTLRRRRERSVKQSTNPQQAVGYRNHELQVEHEDVRCARVTYSGSHAPPSIPTLPTYKTSIGYDYDR
jgi:hypothetical protein